MTPTQTVNIAASSVSTAISTPAIAGALGLSSSAAAWVAGPIVGGIAMAAIALLNRKGPKQKEATTKIVNDAAPILADNLQAFMQGEKTPEAKEWALAIFDKTWQAVVEACSQPQFGNPGKACVEDRQRGGKLDWFKLYREPIEQTQVVERDSSGVLNLPMGVQPNELALVGLIAVTALILLKD